MRCEWILDPMGWLSSVLCAAAVISGECRHDALLTGAERIDNPKSEKQVKTRTATAVCLNSYFIVIDKTPHNVQ